MVLEIPSNLVLHRVGARRWMGRIMISWGIVAAATAFVWDGASLVVARILLGVGEAGFFPGVVYLISCWFPERDRARAMGIFMLGIVIASVIGGPLSGGHLELDGVLGPRGLAVAVPRPGAARDRASASGCCARCPARRPRRAGSRPRSARRWRASWPTESAARERESSVHPARALTDRRILRCAAVYFTINFASYGTIFWFADIIERIGDIEGIELGLLAGHPDGARLGRADRDRPPLGPQRRPPPLGGDRDAARRRSGWPPRRSCRPRRASLTLAVCAFGLLGAIPAFWAMPTSLLTGRAAAGGIALINTIGVTGGLFGPVVVGAAKDAGSLEAGLGVLTRRPCSAARGLRRGCRSGRSSPAGA